MEAKGGGEDGWTCLMAAAYRGHLAICRLLIDKGAQVEARTSGGWTPLHIAAAYDRIDIVRLLCDHGADVDARGDRGWRPLHLAVYNGHISVVKELIEERNADVNASDNGGMTALRLTRRRNNPIIAAYLISHGGIE